MTWTKLTVHWIVSDCDLRKVIAYTPSKGCVGLYVVRIIYMCKRTRCEHVSWVIRVEEHLPLVEFAYNNSYQASIQMALYEALYGGPCRSPFCWTEVGESSITGPDLIRDTLEKVSLIGQRLLTAQSRQKSFTDVRRRPLEFEVGDHVFLKVMPKRVRFGKHGKLSPRFIGPFEVLERVDTIVYRLALPLSMTSVHELFHVSMLQKYTPDPAHVVDWGQIEVDTDGTFEDGPVCILDSRDQVLQRKTVRLVRVLWQHF